MYSLFLPLAAVLVGTKLLGELARRLGQPSLLGELLAGVLLGGGALRVLDPHDPAMRALAELGLFVLLFQIGLRTDVRALGRLGAAAMSVAIAGALLPFGAAVLVARAAGVATVPAVIAGASLMATSLVIPTRVLGKQGVLRTVEGETVLGAAIAGDVLGLVLLSVVAAVVIDKRVTAIGIASISAISLGFIAITLVAGGYAMPPLLRKAESLRSRGSAGMFALAVGLALAAIARESGTAMVVGAFLAGTIFHATPQRQEIDRTAAQVGFILVPVFVAVLGASVELSGLASRFALSMGAALVAVGVLGKVVAGFVPWKYSGNRLVVGVAMVPRGEVGLIFAQLALSTGAVRPPLFAAIMLMVVGTTVVGPPLVRAVLRRDETIDREEVVEDADAREAEGPRQTTVGRRH